MVLKFLSLLLYLNVQKPLMPCEYKGIQLASGLLIWPKNYLKYASFLTCGIQIGPQQILNDGMSSSVRCMNIQKHECENLNGKSLLSTFIYSLFKENFTEIKFMYHTNHSFKVGNSGNSLVI